MDHCEGWFIYKSDWLRLLTELENIGKTLKQNILVEYIIKVRGRLELAKKRALATIKGRDHQQNICVVQAKDRTPLVNISK